MKKTLLWSFLALMLVTWIASFRREDPQGKIVGPWYVHTNDVDQVCFYWLAAFGEPGRGSVVLRHTLSSRNEELSYRFVDANHIKVGPLRGNSAPEELWTIASVDAHRLVFHGASHGISLCARQPEDFASMPSGPFQQLQRYWHRK